MRSILARGVSEALYIGQQALFSSGKQVETRNGPVLEFDTPVMTTYTHSRERVLFYPERDANPYFHLMESLWMLAGRNDVPWILSFNGRMNTYSDDGKTFHGAYGYRWREWFGKDQLKTVLFRLGTYRNDRRAVLGIWDPHQDLVETNDGKDYPCNTQIYFWERRGELNMTVTNRSNDMIWGAYGANAVHMSVLLEYMAAMLGYAVGTYYQFSNNLHAYTDVLKKLEGMQADYEPYLTLAEDGLSYNPPSLVDDPDTFDQELQEWFLDEARVTYNNIYLGTTCGNMRKSWRFWKSKNYQNAFHCANAIEDRAWRKACIEWLQRRIK
tara:strand:- start:4804 stop:5781 length:978 start_codon:yes stop_codon:yes gene_type:complete